MTAFPVVFAIQFLVSAGLVRRHAEGDNARGSLPPPLRVGDSTCDEGHFYTKCGFRSKAVDHKVLAALLEKTSVSVDGVEYGKKAKRLHGVSVTHPAMSWDITKTSREGKKYEAVYGFFKRNPKLTAYLSLPLLDDIVSFVHQGRINVTGEEQELGKTWYMEFSTAQPYVTIYLLKDGHKARMELNQVDQTCGAEGAAWVFAEQPTTKKTVRQVTSTKNFEKCGELNGKYMEGLIEKMSVSPAKTDAEVAADGKMVESFIAGKMGMGGMGMGGAMGGGMGAYKSAYLADLPDEYSLSTSDFFSILNHFCAESSVRDEWACREIGLQKTFEHHPVAFPRHSVN